MNSAITVLTAYLSNNTFRVCVHPERNTVFPDGRPLIPELKFQKVPLHRGSQGMFQARKKGLRFAFDLPTGIFKLSKESEEIVSGTIQTGTFGKPSLFIRMVKGDRLFGFGTAMGKYEIVDTSFKLLTIDTLLSSMADCSYSAFPFFIVKRKEFFIGIYVNSVRPARVTVDSSKENSSGPGATFDFLGTDPVTVDMFVLTGNLDQILSSYSSITAKPFFPPLWSLGFHQSRWSYKSAARVLELAERFRKEDVPCDAIHLDIHYMNRYRVFTWDPNHFKDPEELHKQLSSLGIHTVAIVDPGIAVSNEYEVYRDGVQKDVFCRTSSGAHYEGKVWAGLSVFPDFSRKEVREWWAEKHAALLKPGVSGIWNDMNDPVLKIGKKYDPLAEDIRHGSLPHTAVRNIYANLEAEATALAFQKHKPGSRHFILTRSAFCGIQKDAALWTGDNITSWEHLRENLFMVLNLGMSGVPFCGADVGGFAGRKGLFGVVKIFKKKELFARWMQLGSLMPFFRAHTALYSYDQEPWSFGKEVLKIARKHIKRRYRLLPYIYNLMRLSTLTGAPLVRPLFYYYPEMDAISDQFFLGPSLMAAPVMEEKQTVRKVVLPHGEWYEYETGEKFTGDSEHTFDVSLDYYPLFIKAGTILPTCQAGHNSVSSMASGISFEVYPSHDMEGEVYLDDGVNSKLDEKFMILRMSGRRGRHGKIYLRLHAEANKFTPDPKSVTIRLPVNYQVGKVRGKKITAKKLDLEYEDRPLVMNTYETQMSNGRFEFSFD